MIRLAIVDDHPAVRAGLETALATLPDLEPVGSAESGSDLWPLLTRTRPDVVVLDYHLPGRDGLQLCRRIKAETLPPRVLLYSAYAGSELAIPAILAGADGLIGKNSRTQELAEAIRAVAAGERVLPPVPHALREEAARRIEPDDLPLLGMILDGTAREDMRTVLGIDRPELALRIDRMIGRLRIDVPQVSGG